MTHAGCEIGQGIHVKVAQAVAYALQCPLEQVLLVFMWATRVIYMCDMTHLYVRHDSFTSISTGCGVCAQIPSTISHTYKGVVSHVCARKPSRTGSLGIHACDMSHLYVGHESFTSK